MCGEGVCRDRLPVHPIEPLHAYFGRIGSVSRKLASNSSSSSRSANCTAERSRLARHKALDSWYVMLRKGRIRVDALHQLVSPHVPAPAGERPQHRLVGIRAGIDPLVCAVDVQLLVAFQVFRLDAERLAVARCRGGRGVW